MKNTSVGSARYHAIIGFILASSAAEANIPEDTALGMARLHRACATLHEIQARLSGVRLTPFTVQQAVGHAESLLDGDVSSLTEITRLSKQVERLLPLVNDETGVQFKVTLPTINKDAKTVVF